MRKAKERVNRNETKQKLVQPALSLSLAWSSSNSLTKSSRERKKIRRSVPQNFFGLRFGNATTTTRSYANRFSVLRARAERWDPDDSVVGIMDDVRSSCLENKKGGQTGRTFFTPCHTFTAVCGWFLHLLLLVPPPRFISHIENAHLGVTIEKCCISSGTGNRSTIRCILPGRLDGGASVPMMMSWFSFHGHCHWTASLRRSAAVCMVGWIYFWKFNSPFCDWF